MSVDVTVCGIPSCYAVDQQIMLEAVKRQKQVEDDFMRLCSKSKYKSNREVVLGLQYAAPELKTAREFIAHSSHSSIQVDKK